MSLRQKWFLLGKLMVAYCLLTPIIIFLIYLSGHLNLAYYKSVHQEFYFPLNQFGNFFTLILREVLWEETCYRSPTWLLAVSRLNLTSTLTLRRYNLHYLLFGLTIIIPDIHWAVGHSVLPFLVFLAGLGWGWLVYKTKSLWPAVVSHVTANLLIYFGLKLAGLFIKI